MSFLLFFRSVGAQATGTVLVGRDRMGVRLYRLFTDDKINIISLN
jgi:hypothetical protein